MLNKRMVCAGIAVMGVWLNWAVLEVWAHTVKHPRVFHILVTEQGVECYLNFLLSAGAKTTFWVRWFDRNRNGRLEPSEQLALGQYLAVRYLSKFEITLAGKPQKLLLKEVQNSRLRGDNRKGTYAWDYRWSVKDPELSGNKQRMSFSVPMLFADEVISVALVPTAGQVLRETSTSYVLRKGMGSRAICRIDHKQQVCWFVWERGQNNRGTTRPSGGKRY